MVVELYAQTYSGGLSNPAAALRKVRKEIFKNVALGNRYLAPNVIVLLVAKNPEVAEFRLSHELYETRVDGFKVV